MFYIFIVDVFYFNQLHASFTFFDSLYELNIGRKSNNLRYAVDTTLMAESEEELKSLLMKVKVESEKVGLKLSIRRQRSWHLVPSLHGK